MTSPAIATHEQLGLVALSVAVAIVAGYLALDLAQRSAGTGRLGPSWLDRARAVSTIGLGIWSMHFIGMLALKMAMPVSYDLPLVALSMFAAIARRGDRARRRRPPRIAGCAACFFAAAFMGLAIAAMHYLGMASMEMDATIHWNAALVVLSLLIAFGASLAALYLVDAARPQPFQLGFARRAVAALLLGLGIAGLHYTAMAAATFESTMAGMRHAPWRPRRGRVGGVLAIGAAVMLAILIGGAAADQRRAAAAIDLALVAGLARGSTRRRRPRPRLRRGARAERRRLRLLVETGEDREPIVAAVRRARRRAARRRRLRPARARCSAALAERGESTFIGELADRFGSWPDSAPSRAYYEPLVLDRQPIGLFAIAYRTRHRRVGERTASLLGCWRPRRRWRSTARTCSRGSTSWPAATS